MSEIEIREIHRRLGRLEDADPHVVADRMRRLSADVEALEERVDAMRRTLMGFLVTFAFFGVTLTLSLVAFFGSPTP